MKKFDYTKKEFCEEYPDPEIGKFFKHVDRKTSLLDNRPDFYRHWGFSRDCVRKSWASQTYEIPVEVASLYAELIRIFKYTYGADRRGVSAKKDEEKYPLKKYQQYLGELDTMIEDRLEPYQACMIKNHYSYQQTKIFQQLLPVLLERIAMLLSVCVDYGTDDSHDTYYITDQEIDKLIEHIIRKRLLADINQTMPLHSFEDAISNVFETLSTSTQVPPVHRPVFLSELDQSILNERIAFRQELEKRREGVRISQIDSAKVGRERQSLIDRLNKTAAPFLKDQKQLEASLKANTDEIIDELQNFWDENRQLSRQDLSLVEAYHRNLVSFLSWLTEISENAKEKLSVDNIKERLKVITQDHVKMKTL